MWAAERIAWLEALRIKGTRWAGLPGAIGKHCNEDGGDANHLYFALDRNDRAMAEGSASGEENCVSFRVQDNFRHFGRGTFVDVSQLLAVAHKSQMFITDTSDNSFRC